MIGFTGAVIKLTEAKLPREAQVALVRLGQRFGSHMLNMNTRQRKSALQQALVAANAIIVRSGGIARKRLPRAVSTAIKDRLERR